MTKRKRAWRVVWKGDMTGAYKMVVSASDVLGLAGALSVQTVHRRLGQVR